MGEPTSPLQRGELNVGARIHVRQGVLPVPELVGQMGTVIEVFRVPRDSCRVRIDGDPDRQREWFFYRDEVLIGDA